MEVQEIELDAYQIAAKVFSNETIDTNYSFEDLDLKTLFEMLLIITTEGLKKFYGVTSKEGLEFFEAHKSADVIHRAECDKLLDDLTKEEQDKAETASLLTARYLWNFLSGMTSKHKLQYIAA